MNTFIPPPPQLSAILHTAMYTAVPHGFYHIPARLYPTFLVTLSGKIVLHHGGETLTFPNLVICGGTRQPRLAWADQHTHIFNIAIRHGQMPRLFGEAAGLLMDTFAPWQSLLTPNLQAPVCRLAERLPVLTPSQAIADIWQTLAILTSAHAAYTDTLFIPPQWLHLHSAELSTAFACSARQLERRFQAAYGQSLRAYRRQIRCSRAIPLLLNCAHIPLVTLATECGYYDQAHFQRDILHFTGHTPTHIRQAVLSQSDDVWAFNATAKASTTLFGSEGF